jgi:hypothetical protein
MIDALPLLLAPEGYQISRSVRLRESAAASFTRTPASSGDRKLWTWSGWIKRGDLETVNPFFGASVDADTLTTLNFNSTGTIRFYRESGTVLVALGETTAVYRDPSAWYHIVCAYDSAQASSTNRLKIYANGVQQTFTWSTTLPLDHQSNINANQLHSIGTAPQYTSTFDGYITEVNFIDGQALDPSSFGETNPVTGVWRPKKYIGTYGTNGFYLNFSDNSSNTSTTIGKDHSGNGNNWTPNNISVTSGITYDSMLDVPTPWDDGGNGRGNYPVWNPIEPNAALGGGTVDGNLLGYPANTAGTGQLKATVNFPTSGKFYCEVTPTVITSATATIGLLKSTIPVNTAPSSVGDEYVYRSNGNKSDGSTVTSYGATYTTNDVIGIAFDIDAGTITFYKNGTTQGEAYSGITGEYVASARDSATGGVVRYAINFGQRPFAYTPPTGFKALNTQNLPTPTILKGNQYFDVALQTGNTTGRTVSGLAFQPDLVWVKNRAGSSNRRWGVIDSVRGVNKTLSTALTDAEVTSQSDLLTAFNSDGFTIGADAGLYGWNGFAESYAHFTWKEGPTQGFDIVTYTGNASGAARSVAHNLGVAPRLMITKGREAQVTGTDNWLAWHGAFGAGEYLVLNSTAAKATSSSYWGNTVPTSSNFFVGGGASNVHNESGKNYIAYLFSEVAGFSRMGSYTGNGSADGPFVFCGFRPKWIMIKRTDSATSANWLLIDASRNPSNNANLFLLANSTDAEGTNNEFDILSNGFKCRFVGGNSNISAATYIFAAFAENPFKYALAR